MAAADAIVFMQAQAQGKHTKAAPSHFPAAPPSPTAAFASGAAPRSTAPAAPFGSRASNAPVKPAQDPLSAALAARAKAAPNAAPKPTTRASASAARGARPAAAPTAAAQKRAEPDTTPARGGRGGGGGGRKRAKVADLALGPSQESDEGNEEMENQQVMLMRMINTMMAVRPYDCSFLCPCSFRTLFLHCRTHSSLSVQRCCVSRCARDG